jgi:hypothetical protein
MNSPLAFSDLTRETLMKKRKQSVNAAHPWSTRDSPWGILRLQWTKAEFYAKGYPERLSGV